MEIIQRYCDDCAAQEPVERIKDGFITYRCTCCRKATTEVYNEDKE